MAKYKRWNSKTMKMEWVEDNSEQSNEQYIQTKDGSVGTTQSFTKAYKKWDNKTKTMKWADTDGNIQLTKKEYNNIIKQREQEIKDYQKQLEKQKPNQTSGFINKNVKTDLGVGINIAATVGDFLSDAGRGIFDTLETIVMDLPTLAIGYGVGMFDKKTGKTIRDFASKQIISDALTFNDPMLEKYSYLGGFSDKIPETITGFLTTGGLGSLASKAVLKTATTGLKAAQATGDVVKIANATKNLENAANIARWAPLYLKSSTQATLQADQEGANAFQAIAYGVASGATEVITEQMFSFLGKKPGTKLGLSGFKGITEKTPLDEMIVGRLTGHMKNGIVKNALQSSLLALGEGFEEVVSGVSSATFKTALSLNGNTNWLKDKTYDDLLKDEHLGEAFFLGSITSGILGVPSAVVTGATTGTPVISNETDTDTQENQKKKIVKTITNEIEKNTLNLKDDKFYKELVPRLDELETEANNANKLTKEELSIKIKETADLLGCKDNGFFGANTTGKYYLASYPRLINIYEKYTDTLANLVKQESKENKKARIKKIKEDIQQVKSTPENNIGDEVALITELDALVESVDADDPNKSESKKIRVEHKQQENFILAQKYIDMVNEQIKSEKLDGEIKLSDIREQGLRTWEIQMVDLCKSMGIQLIYVDSEINFKGATLPSSKGSNDVTVMFYNRNKSVHPSTVKAEVRDGKTTYKANIQEEMLYTIGHETFHHILAKESELAKNILKFVEENATEAEITEFVQRRYSYSLEAQDEILKNKDLLFEEMAADEFATLIINEEFLIKIKSVKPELATQIEDITKRILRTSTKGSFYSDLTYRGLDTMLKIFDATVQNAQEEVDKLIQQEGQLRAEENIQKGHDAYREYAEKGANTKEERISKELEKTKGQVEQLKEENKELKKLARKAKRLETKEQKVETQTEVIKEEPEKTVEQPEIKQEVEKETPKRKTKQKTEIEKRLDRQDDPIEILTDYLLEHSEADNTEIQNVLSQLQLDEFNKKLADDVVKHFKKDKNDFINTYKNYVVEEIVEEEPVKETKETTRKTLPKKEKSPVITELYKEKNKTNPDAKLEDAYKGHKRIAEYNIKATPTQTTVFARDVSTEELNTSPVQLIMYNEDGTRNVYTYENKTQLLNDVKNSYGGFKQITDNGSLQYTIMSARTDGEFYMRRDARSSGGWSWIDVNGEQVKTNIKQASQQGVTTRQISQEEQSKLLERKKQSFERMKWGSIPTDQIENVINNYETYKQNGGEPVIQAEMFVRQHPEYKQTVNITDKGVKLMTGAGEYRQSKSMETLFDAQEYKNLIKKSPELINEVPFYYQTKTTKSVETRALDILNNELETLVTTITAVNKPNSGISLDAENVVASQMLLEIAIKNNDREFISTISNALLKSTTNSGQILTLQKRLMNSGNADLAVSLISKDIYSKTEYKIKQNPNDKILSAWLNEKFNDNGTLKNENFHETPEFKLISLITAANQTVQENDTISPQEKDIQNTIAVEMIRGVLTNGAPVSLNFATKLTNFRRLAMLSRLKTQARNILSNYVQYGLTTLGSGATNISDNLIAKVIDTKLTPEMRKEWNKFNGEAIKQYTTLTNEEKKFTRQLAKDDANFANQINKKLGINIYDTSTEVRDTQFNNKYLDGWAKKLGYTMEYFDNRAFALYLNMEIFRQQKLLAEAQGKTNLSPEEISNIKLSPQMSNRCMAIARELTFKSKDSAVYKASKKMIEGVNELVNVVLPNSNIGSLLQPFLLTPANVGQMIMEASPVGYAMSINQGKQLLQMLEHQDRYSPVEIAQKSRELSRTIGRAFAGTIVATTGAVLKTLGLITGKGPDDEDEKQLLKAQGWQPYSIKIGDAYVSYDWASPAGAILGMGANITEANGEWYDVFTGIIDATGEQFKENTVLETLAPLFNEAYDDNLIDRLLGVVETIPSSFVPGFLQEIADTLDPKTKQTYDKNFIKSMYQQTAARIPIIKSTLTTKTDRMGNDIGKSPFNILIPAGNLSTTVDNNGVGEHILDLMNETGNTNLLPPKMDVNLSYKVNGVQKKVTFTKEQQLEMTKEAGDIYTNIINQLLNQNSYLNASTSDKIKMIDIIRQYAKGKAVTDSGYADGYVSGNNEYQKIDKYTDAGLTLENALQLAVYINPIVGDKDSEGNTITGTETAKKAYKIMSYNIPTSQKDIMLKLIQSSTNKNPETSYDLKNLLSEQDYKDYFGLSKDDMFMMRRYSRNDYQTSLKLGINGDTFMNYYNFVDNVKADYTSDGKEITNSKKQKIINYLNKQPLNIAQKAYLLSQQGYSIKEYQQVMTEYLNQISDLTYDEKLELYETMFPMK